MIRGTRIPVAVLVTQLAEGHSWKDILRNTGHDLVRAEEAGQSRANDAEIMTRVVEEDRVLITLDEHFGDRAILPLDKHPCVIRLKIHQPYGPSGPPPSTF